MARNSSRKSKKSRPKRPNEPADVLYRIKRGLVGYVSYLAACEMNEAFSEYVLYEPILRILTARGYTVECEYICPGAKHPAVGDKKRIDFFAAGHSLQLAIEVKWAKSKSPDVSGDVEKLSVIRAELPSAIALLCIFGRRSHIERLELDEPRLEQRGKTIIADLRKTRYSCRIFELDRNSSR